MFLYKNVRLRIALWRNDPNMRLQRGKETHTKRLISRANNIGTGYSTLLKVCSFGQYHYVRGFITAIPTNVNTTKFFSCEQFVQSNFTHYIIWHKDESTYLKKRKKDRVMGIMH